MSDEANEQLARRYIEAGARNDLDALDEMRAPDWQLRWPATDELVPSSAAYRAIHENFPGGFPRFDDIRVAGPDDRYLLTAAYTIVRVSGTGDLWLAEARVRYADDSAWCMAKVLEVRDSKIHRETDYWSRVEERPGWRLALTERLSAPNP
jgi:ketosteroid isomerase-like protein